MDLWPTATEGRPGNRAVDPILELRPQAKPNRLVLVLGIAQFMEIEEARRLAGLMICEPRLDRNRFNFLNSRKYRG